MKIAIYGAGAIGAHLDAVRRCGDDFRRLARKIESNMLDAILGL
jgi:hypothetical protein